MSEPSRAHDGDEWITVSRVVFPVSDDAAVEPLYLNSDPLQRGVHATVTGRGSLSLPQGGAASTGTYFNAFPIGYWSRYTDVGVVRFEASVAGVGRAVLWRSNSTGASWAIDERPIDGRETISFEVQTADFADGGMCWVDLRSAESSSLSFSDGQWQAALTSLGAGRTTVGITTFDRVSYCIAQLRALGSDAEVVRVIDAVVVVDQGTSHVSDDPAFAGAAAALGSRLRVHRQQNLGGSGGFARAMVEALAGDTSRYVLILDDDAISEPESILRAVRFADAAHGRVVVGGGMFHLDARSVLYAQAEQWKHSIGWFRLDSPDSYDHDFARQPFEEAAMVHQVRHADFNGWWMCLMPLTLLRTAGLALPLFLKGDDVEFGLRAAEHGYPTVSLPGVAVWHMGWHGKSPTRTWEAYFLHRNRLITALLHSPYRRGRLVVAHSLLGDIKLLLALHYSAVQLRAEAILDAALGPERLWEWLPTRIDEIRAVWSSFSEVAPADDVPRVLPIASIRPPSGPWASARRLGGVVMRHLLKADKRTPSPELHVGAADLGWWTFAEVDSALVEGADGSRCTVYRRDRARSRRYLRRSLALHARLWLTWPTLARRYRSASPALTAEGSWRDFFDSSASAR